MLFTLQFIVLLIIFCILDTTHRFDGKILLEAIWFKLKTQIDVVTVFICCLQLISIKYKIFFLRIITRVDVADNDDVDVSLFLAHCR